MSRITKNNRYPFRDEWVLTVKVPQYLRLGHASQNVVFDSAYGAPHANCEIFLFSSSLATLACTSSRSEPLTAIRIPCTLLLPEKPNFWRPWALLLEVFFSQPWLHLVKDVVIDGGSQWTCDPGLLGLADVVS